MNALIDPFPHTVLVGDELFEIDTSFTTGIRFETLMLDDTLDEAAKTALALNLYFPVIPTDTEHALAAAAWFYRCGKEPPRSTQSDEPPKQRRIYDYDVDSVCILCAFREQYQIDLQSTDLHWWLFREMFENLRDDTAFVKRMAFRCADTGKMKGEQRAYYLRMKRLYALPSTCTESEKEKRISEALLSGGDVQAVLENTPKM